MRREHLSVSEITEGRSCSVSTVRQLEAQARRRLGACTTSQAVRIAIRLGLI